MQSFSNITNAKHCYFDKENYKFTRQTNFKTIMSIF